MQKPIQQSSPVMAPAGHSPWLHVLYWRGPPPVPEPTLRPGPPPPDARSRDFVALPLPAAPLCDYWTISNEPGTPPCHSPATDRRSQSETRRGGSFETTGILNFGNFMQIRCRTQ